MDSKSSSKPDEASASEAGCYWNRDGKYQADMDLLHELIDEKVAEEGLEKFVANPANKHLNKLRWAKNVYYDMYNNGLCNLRDVAYRMFGLAEFKPLPEDSEEEEGEVEWERSGGEAEAEWGQESEEWNESVYDRVEAKMDEFVLKAKREQGAALAAPKTKKTNALVGGAPVPKEAKKAKVSESESESESRS